jgi:alpha-beta hydrolase superfamily lysophospholipase
MPAKSHTPSHSLTHTLTRPDGLNLFVRDWPVDGARAHVLIVHGLGEHIGRYDALARWLNARGIAVRGFDHCGHGQSGGVRGVLMTPQDMMGDTAAVFSGLMAEASAPVFLLGHSMGGLIATSLTVQRVIEPRGLIASSPAFNAGLSALQRALVSTLNLLAPNLTLGNGLKVDKLSHDIGVVNAYKTDTLVHNRISARLAGFIHREGQVVLSHAGLLNIPMLLMVAGADELVNPQGSRDFAQAAPAELLTYKLYESAYHEIFNETPQYREPVLADLQRWIEQTL